MTGESIIQGNINKMCHYCGRYIEIPHQHHIFGGPNRKISDRYGLWVWLCPHHHELIHSSSKYSKDMMQKYHEIGQKAFEDWYMNENGVDQETAKQKFMEIFGRNYL